MCPLLCSRWSESSLGVELKNGFVAKRAVSWVLAKPGLELIVFAKKYLQGFADEVGFGGIDELGIFCELRSDVLLNADDLRIGIRFLLRSMHGLIKRPCKLCDSSAQPRTGV